jgi:sigma-B regulation protein RsbU (phosphoserine phosphatase)
MIKSRRHKSLAARLSLWIISICTIIFATALITNYFLSRSLLEDYVSDLAKTTTSSTVRKVETELHAIASNADSLASVISRSDISEQQIHQIINAFLISNSAVFGMAVALEPHTLIGSMEDFSPYYYRENNTIAFSNLASDNYNYKSHPWYTEVKKLNAPAWSEPYYDTGGGNVRMVTYSTPINSKEHKSFAGVATADIELRWLDRIVKQIKIGETGYGFIISKDDVIIAHPDLSLNMKKLDATSVKPENWQRYLESKKESSDVYFKTLCYDRDEHCWIAIETLGNTGWKVIVVVPEQELIAKINRLTLKISTIAIIGLLTLAFVIILLTSHLTRPLGNLATATRNIGVGNLDTPIPGAVRDDEIGALTDDFSAMRDALKIHIAEIQQVTAKQQKLESEIQIAKDIQMSMIPGAGDVIEKHDLYQLLALLRPARSVGGDLYYYQQSGQQLDFIIGDVSDKGIPAALFMAKTVTLYTRALKEKLTPGQTLTMMNDLLTQNNEACMFVTALSGSIDLKTGNIIMANAGHMNPIIKSLPQAKEQEITGATALGLMDGVTYPDVAFQLESDAYLIMYTDGISEAHDSKGAQYTDMRLINLIADTHSTSIEHIGTNIIKSVDDFATDTEQFDDITLLIIHYA